MKHAIYVIVDGQLKLLSAYNNKEIAESLYKKYSRNGKFEVILALYNENIPVVTTGDLYTLGIKKIAGDLDQEFKRLKQRFKDLQAESDSKDTAVFNANAKYNELKKKYEELERKCDFIDFNFSTLSSHNEVLEKNNTDLTRKNEKLQSELTGIKLENYYLEEKLNKKKWWQR